tara:strand:+ start:103 stop:384 length:282 start_codon:yes stop_codon:yes gene_type:complete
MIIYTTNIKNQYEAKPENIVAIILLEKIPITIAIIAANIFGLSSISNKPLSFMKIAGKMIAGNMAEGTKDNTSLILSLNISFLIKAIIVNLVR